MQGQTHDVPLTQTGRAQAAAAAEELAGICGPGVSLTSSDLLRASQTAEVIAARLGAPLVLDARLRERGLGRLEGLPLADALALAGEVDWTDPAARPGDGESLGEVYDRLAELFAALPDGEHVLITHGDTARVAQAVLAGLPASEIPYGIPANGSVLTLSRRAS